MAENDNVKLLERQIKGKPVYIILLYTFIITLIGLLVYMGLIITATYKIGVGKEYELFRDFLFIFLMIFALAIGLGYEVYLRIIKHVNESMKKREEDFILLSTALLYVDMGFFHWQHYHIDYKKEGIKEKEGIEENKQNEYAVHHKNNAIDLTERAYKKVLKLDLSDQRNERLKCQIMNNLGWYLAEGGEDEDRDFSKKCAYYIMKRIENFPDKRKDWQETFDYIIEKYGPANQSKLE
jgi:hypothetical protein